MSSSSSSSSSSSAETHAAETHFKFAALQFGVTTDKAQNIKVAQEYIDKAVEKGAQVVCLPECWNSPYSTSSFAEYAEEVEGSNIDAAPSLKAISDKAAQHKVFVIGGSIPERDDGKIFNTCFVFGPDGHLLGKYRKMHLFDINIPGRITFKESDTLSPGNDLLAFPTPWGKIGVGICYDIRFPELARVYQQLGVVLIAYPGAFNFTTGPAHWKLLQRSRALDYQVFVAGVSPALVPTASYHSWGHSQVTDPWGTILGQARLDPDVIVADIDVDRLRAIRQQIPTTIQLRPDVYTNAFAAALTPKQ